MGGAKPPHPHHKCFGSPSGVAKFAFMTRHSPMTFMTALWPYDKAEQQQQHCMTCCKSKTGPRNFTQSTQAAQKERMGSSASTA